MIGRLTELEQWVTFVVNASIEVTLLIDRYVSYGRRRNDFLIFSHHCFYQFDAQEWERW